MLDLTVSLHIVAPCKLLAAHRTLVTLGPVNVGVMPPIWHRFVTTYAAIQGRKGARQLDKQRGVVNVVVTTAVCRWRRIAAIRWGIAAASVVQVETSDDADTNWATADQAQVMVAAAWRHQRVLNKAAITCNITGTTMASRCASPHTILKFAFFFLLFLILSNFAIGIFFENSERQEWESKTG